MTDNWILFVSEPGAEALEVEIVDGLTIGRHPTNGLVLQDSHVSGHHAQIRFEGDQPIITDIGSNNGTRIGEDLVLEKGQRSALRHGMCIYLGRVELRVDAPDAFASDGGSGGDSTAGGEFDEVRTVANEMIEESAEATIAAQPPPPPPPPKPKPAAPPRAPAAKKPQASRPAASASAAPEKISRRATPSDSNHDGLPDIHDSTFDQTIVGDTKDSFGAEAKLERMQARLLILNDADLRAVEVDQLDFTIGRGPDQHCRLRNQGVSSAHARITLQATQNLFLIEDLGSGNGTQLDGAPVLASAPRELRCDAYLRFGTIEAIFLQGLDSELKPLGASRHNEAAKLLVNRGQLNAAALKEAQKSAEQQQQSLGEVLLLGQHVKPREWSRAVEDARVATTLRDLSGTGSFSRAHWLVAGAVALVLLLVFLLTR